MVKVGGQRERERVSEGERSTPHIDPTASAAAPASRPQSAVAARADRTSSRHASVVLVSTAVRPTVARRSPRPPPVVSEYRGVISVAVVVVFCVLIASTYIALSSVLKCSLKVEKWSTVEVK
ncbi:uncharacterized protein LOC124356556 isoform X2 [Homalodisca vitripennis]|uniref:uncharacterized protein LOC124356556 isoform X2 n=1 Tax=Homalodisca vitripennis TaxID=197043 RepID=UPI001EEA020C|nr:uncharacterized protein LOC124356556 isoform X2 [Homalodisca vitripennis]